MEPSETAVADLSEQHHHHVIADIYQHVVQLQQQVTSCDLSSFSSITLLQGLDGNLCNST